MTKEEFLRKHASGYIGVFEKSMESLLESEIAHRMDKVQKRVSKLFEEVKAREDRVELADVLKEIK